jgi:hypothetical protein
MEEYCEIVELNPVFLLREDLQEMQRVLLDGFLTIH